MNPTYTLPEFPLTFHRVLRFSSIDGGTPEAPIVRYEEYDQELGRETTRGIALIVRNGNEVVYCDAFSNIMFARKWLYTLHEYVFHSIRKKIAKEFYESESLEVYILNEEKLKAQLGQHTNPWVSASSIEERLIIDLHPAWNF